VTRLKVFVGGSGRVRGSVKERAIPVDDALTRGDAADHFLLLMMMMMMMMMDDVNYSILWTRLI
jgi:hypothetical protein